MLGSKHYDDISGTNSENFSRADRTGANLLAAALKKPNCFLRLGTPSGAVRQYSTATDETTTVKRGSQD